MGKYAKYWYTLIGVLIVTFSLLGYYGVEVYRTAPPIPGKVLVQGSDKPLYTEESILDGQTRAQAETTAAMPFVFPHVALMPDAHLGKGATVGSVIPTLGAIIPAAIGVDIGCGMIAVRTQFTEDDLPPDRRAVRELIERAIPLSGGARNTTIR